MRSAKLAALARAGFGLDAPVVLELPSDAEVEGNMLPVARILACQGAEEVEALMSRSWLPGDDGGWQVYNSGVQLEARARAVVARWAADAIRVSDAAAGRLREGIKVPDDEGHKVLTDQVDMVEALRNHWAPIFQVKPKVPDWQVLAGKYIAEHAPQLEVADLLPPDRQGRNFLDNICLLDATARAAGLQESGKPIMALFDFGDAFPSLRTEWMLLMLIRSGFVGGVRYVLEALYWLPTAYVELAGAMALGRHDFLALGAWAPGLRIRSLLATGCAAAMRSALSTVSNWKELHAWLQAQVLDHGSLWVIGSGTLSPPYWQTRPIVQFLASAQEDFANDRVLARPAAAARKALVRAYRDAAERGVRVRAQKTLYSSLHASLHPDLLHLLIQRRLKAWGLEVEGGAQAEFRMLQGPALSGSGRAGFGGPPAASGGGFASLMG
ncbi:unnamed protein product [Prorocentrum cordatum]|uniref:Reverse transcriptase domain-containing protein n=1 Tax=Prorocentrum cordatum TaxID=2364126 RepID=A0ABN9TB52_9DINO|nr:unnamed protein product [Polarella glacialis]